MAKKQQDLIEGRGIKALDDAAEAVKTLTTTRMEKLKQEIDARDLLLKLMRQHKRAKYVYDGYEVEVIPGKDKVKVRSQKDDEEEEED